MTKIKSVRVLSAAKVNGVLYGIVGLLIAPFVLLGPGLAIAGGERRGFSGAVIFAVFLPLIYAGIGFFSGALLAFIYNAISHAIGGIEVELLIPSAPVTAPPDGMPPIPDVPSTPEGPRARSGGANGE